MLDKYLEIAHREQEKTAANDRFLSLMMQLPDEELHEMVHTGHIKVGYFSDSAILGDGGDRPGWLDHFKGTPLMPQAISLLEEELKAQAADDQSDVVQSQERQQKEQARDALRLQKRLLELELVKQQEGAASAAQPPPAPTPGMGPPTAQGAGALGDVPAEGATDGNPQKMASIKLSGKSEESKHPSYQEGKFLGRHLDKATAAYGAVQGARALHNSSGLIGHGRNKRLGYAAGGALLGGLAGHGFGRFTQGAIHGAAHSEDKEEKKEKKGGVGEFLRAAAPAVGNFVKEHPGAAIGGGVGALHGLLHQGGGVGSALLEGAGGAALGHGAEHMYRSGVLKGALGEQGDLPKTSTVAKEAAARPPFSFGAEKTAHRRVHAIARGPVGGAVTGALAGSIVAGHKEKRAFGAFLGALGGALAGSGMRAAATSAASGALGAGAKTMMGGGLKGLATQGANWLKANPMKAVGGAMNAASNFAQARQQGQGLGGSALSGIAGGASALG